MLVLSRRNWLVEVFAVSFRWQLHVRKDFNLILTEPKGVNGRDAICV